MEFIAFIAGAILTWPVLIGVCVLGIWTETNDSHNASVFFGLLAAAIAYVFFEIPLATMAIVVVTYFVIGFMWSFWRYKRHCDKTVAIVAGLTNKISIDSEIRKMSPANMVWTMSAWVIVWPFSMIENVTGDIVNMVQTAITTFFNSVYTRIFENAISKMRVSNTDGAGTK